MGKVLADYAAPYFPNDSDLCVYTVIDTANYNEGGNINALINSQIFDANYMYSYAAAMSWMYFVVIARCWVLCC